MERRISISTPAVGSSRINNFGSCTSARAIISRRFMPPDKVRDMSSRLSHKESCLRYFSVRCFASAPRDAVEPRLVYHDVEYFSNWLKLISCGTRPIQDFALSISVSMS